MNTSQKKTKKIKLWLILVPCVLLIIPVIWCMIIRLEGSAPVVTIDLLSPAVGLSKELTVSVSDEGTGLKKVWFGLLKDGKEVILDEKNFPSSGFLKGGKIHEKTLKIIIEPGKLGVTDGNATLRILAKDYSWRNNKTYITTDIIIDTKPPEIDVLSRSHNITQGGSGLAIYRIHEKDTKSGIQVGDNFFPGHSGYFQDVDIYLAFFALDYKQGPGTSIHVTASDRAGNKSRAGFYHYIKKKVFKKDKIKISDRFLSWKVPEFNITSGSSLVDKFLIINRDVRKSNSYTITEVGEKTDNIVYWQDAFQRLNRAATKAGFADHRTYFYKGKEIDKQIHLGIDLASVSRSPVPAANRGKVVLIDNIGIYGKTVVLDHGFGLFSTYSHLSSINVQVGQIPAKGDILGHTGITGMAGGDHLHFGMYVHKTFVNPLEWWDASWIQNNIISKIDEALKGQ